MNTRITDQSKASYVASGLDVIRADVLGHLLLSTFLCAVFAAVILGEDAWVQSATIFIGCGLSCLWGYGWREHHCDLAALGFCGGCFATLTVIVAAVPESGAATFYAAIVCMVAATSQLRYAVVSAIASCATILIVAQHAELVPSISVVIGLVGSVATISWLVAFPVQTVLAWSWSSHAQAMQQVERLRDQQGTLQRTIKSLNEAYQRLEDVNQELTRVREAALDARRRKAEFVVNLSHELRTPLNLILGFSRMVVQGQRTYGMPLPVPYRQDVEAIFRNAQHLSALVDDILDLGQIEAGRMALRKEHVSISQVVSEAVAAVAGLYEHKGLSLRIEISAGLHDGYFDRTRVRQVLINLLSNAVRFTDEGGVTIRATVDDTNLVLAVHDTGIGIRSEDQPLIWEEFRQFGPPERCHGGSGMGLAISKLFVELHGGNIWVESAPDRGSTFYVSLPRTESIDTIPLPVTWQTRVRTDQSRQAVAVVLVTDDPANGRLFERYLDGYRVFTTQNETRAVRYARATHAAGIVVIGPSQEALEPICVATMQDAPDLPVVTCVLPSPTADWTAQGVVARIPKPVLREDLVAVLRRLGRTIRKVMVVDDDPETVRLIGRLVRSVSLRYRVTDALGGAEALAILERECPDVVVLDLVMPGVDGRRVLAAIQAREDRTIPVILITGQTFGGDAGRIVSISMSRSGGLTVRETMRGLQSMLGAVDLAATVGGERSPQIVPPA